MSRSIRLANSVLRPLSRARLFSHSTALMSGGQWGDGAGHGGGGGGRIRDAGGAFGRKEVAEEEKYFRGLQAEQFESLKHRTEYLEHEHERQIKEHELAIQRHKDELKRLQDHKEKHEGTSSDSD